MSSKTHQLDATGKPVGRLATEVANLLRGKHRVDFQYHVDHGESVEVHHVGKMVLTGNKLATKTYIRFSGYPGGIKVEKARYLMQAHPEVVLRNAVERMLPKNKLRRRWINRLTIVND